MRSAATPAARAHSASGRGARCRSRSPSRARSAAKDCPRSCCRRRASSGRRPTWRSTRSASAPSAVRRWARSGRSTAPGRATARRSRDAPSGIVTLRNVLTDWSVRLVVGALLLPAILAALDAFFRARRRRVSIGPWLAWLAVAAVPLPVAWAWLRALGATGVLDAPDGPVMPDRFPLETNGIVAMVSALLAGALACAALRFAVGALRLAGGAGRGRQRRAPAPGPGRRRAGGRDRRVALRPGDDRLAAEPLRRRRAGAGDAPVAVRRRRLARRLGGAGDHRRPGAGRADRRLLRLRARSRAARAGLGLGAGGDLRLRPLDDAARRRAAGGAGRRDPGAARAPPARPRGRTRRADPHARARSATPGPGSLGGTESALRR